MLHFEPVEHLYRLDGQVIPSVTQVLKPLYDFSMVAPEVLERKRLIGTAVHRAIELSIMGDLDESTIAPEWAGYLNGWKRFLDEARIHPADIGEPEKPLAHATYRFAGTPDIPICIERRWGVLDLKTAEALHPAWALQAAAYQELMNANTPKGQRRIEDRYTLQLRENGSYRLERYTDRNDFNVFLSLLTVKRWQEKHQPKEH